MGNRYFLQIFASFSGALATFTTGQMMGWMSPSSIFLESNESPVPGGITSSEASWVASFPMIGNIFGILLVVSLVDIIGRQRMILFSTIPVLTSWILLYFARSIELLYIARFIVGIGETVGKVTMFMYIGEIAEATIRGALGTFLVVTLNIGIFFEYSLGAFCSYYNLTLASAIIPILLFATFLFMPESPYYLLLRGEMDRAEHSLKRLRPAVTDVTSEINEIKSTIEENLAKKDAFKMLFTIRKYRNMLFLTCVLFALQELSGITPLIMYAEKIFENVNYGVLTPSVTPILLPVVKIFATLVTTVFIDSAGRRPLLMISSLLCGLCLIGLSAFYYFLDIAAHDMEDINWIPIVLLTGYHVMFILGMGTLPFVMIGELFPTNIKSIAVCITGFCSPISSVFITKLFQILSDSFGKYLTFAFFSISCFVAFTISMCCLPETKKQTLAQIQNNVVSK